MPGDFRNQGNAPGPGSIALMRLRPKRDPWRVAEIDRSSQPASTQKPPDHKVARGRRGDHCDPLWYQRVVVRLPLEWCFRTAAAYCSKGLVIER